MVEHSFSKLVQQGTGNQNESETMNSYQTGDHKPKHARQDIVISPSPRSWRLVLGIIGLISFLGLTACVALNMPFVTSIDSAIQSVIFPLRNEGMTPVLSFITDMSDTLVSVIVAVAFAAYLLIRIGKREAITYLSCIVIGEAIIAAVKFIVDRTRPIGMNLIDFPSDASFPSGHTFAAIAIVSFTLFVIIRTHPGIPGVAKVILVILAILWPIFIAFTRIYLGAHWPTDIIGSALIGAVAFIPLATYAWDRICD